MSIIRDKQYYLINTRQFKEMKKFYEKLGYSDKQVKKLCAECFGAEIRVSDSERYSENWTFMRRIEYKPRPFERMNKAAAGGRGAVMSGNFELEDGECGIEPLEMCGMPMPMMSAMPMAAAMSMGAAPAGMMGMAGIPASAEPAEFNTAETHVAPENEAHSPLDNPQLIFSANVNTASWSYLRNMISRKDRIDKSFVRIEEIINSYPYKLKKPKDGELFSISAEKAKCPWNDEAELMFVGFKGKKADKKVRHNLSLLVDVSGSMEDEWILVQMSIAAIVSKLKKGDYISIIAYSDNTVTVEKQLDCGDLDKCVKAILSIDGIGGCTNGSEGLNNAYEYLKDNFGEDANNRVFIFTDGDFNFGITNEGGLKDFIYEKRKTGIYLSIVGYGQNNFKDNKMEALAQNGNGNYTFVANPNDILDNLWEKLSSNLVTVAKDVKISVELNPEYVSKYRLIGYDARILTQKEFHDTEKATDGIGSEHNVVALIELKPGEAKQVYSTRYVSTKAYENKDEFAFVEVHYKSPDDENLVMTKAITVDEINSAEPKNIHLAAMLAGFGLLVKDSDYKEDMNIDKLADMLKRFEDDKEIDTEEKYSHFDIIRRYIHK